MFSGSRLPPALFPEPFGIYFPLDEFADGECALPFVIHARMFATDPRERGLPDSDLLKLLDGNESRAQAIVKVVRIIGDLIRKIGDLRYPPEPIPFSSLTL